MLKRLYRRCQRICEVPIGRQRSSRCASTCAITISATLLVLAKETLTLRSFADDVPHTSKNNRREESENYSSDYTDHFPDDYEDYDDQEELDKLFANNKTSKKANSYAPVTVSRSTSVNYCDQYNSLSDIFRPILRRRRCLKHAGCQFVSGSLSGQCVPIVELSQDSFGIDKDEQIELDNTWISGGSRDDQRTTSEAQQAFPSPGTAATTVNEHIQNAAVDSIRDSHNFLREVARNIVVTALNDPQAAVKLGETLKTIVGYEREMLAPTRDLILWSLRLETTIDYTNALSKLQSRYWTMDPVGREYTLAMLASLAKWWIKVEDHRKGYIHPLIDWCLLSKDSEVPSLIIESIVASVPWAKVTTTILLLPACQVSRF